MSVTDELRRLLDERGVEYKRHYLNTLWYAGTKLYMATDNMDGTLTVDNLTPEQAIAATLGSGTCHIVERNGDLYCDACGDMVGTCDPASELFIDGNAVKLWNYCPNCGAKVIGDSE